jgi:hypothetical protein
MVRTEAQPQQRYLALLSLVYLSSPIMMGIQDLHNSSILLSPSLVIKPQTTLLVIVYMVVHGFYSS